MSTSIATALDGRHVRDVVRGSVVTAHAQTTVAALAALMVVYRIHGVLLTDREQAQWVSDLDVLGAVVDGLTDWRFRDRFGVPTLTSETSLREAARVLARAEATHALVREDGNVTGVVSALDVCAAVAGSAVRGGAPPCSTTLSLEERHLARVSAQRVMHDGVVSADPRTPLADLAQTMSRVPIHSVVVEGLRRGSGGEHLVWGVATDVDIVRALAAGFDDATAADIAGTEPLCVESSDSLDDIAHRLCEHAVSHIIVTDATGRPCGVISTLDVLRVVAGGSGI